MKKSFTLIELLVVIAIIAILASMLMPALSKARAKARAISCVNQLKQLNLAYQMYADDHEGFIPQPIYGVWAGGWSDYLRIGGYQPDGWGNLKRCFCTTYTQVAWFDSLGWQDHAYQLYGQNAFLSGGWSRGKDVDGGSWPNLWNIGKDTNEFLPGNVSNTILIADGTNGSNKMHVSLDGGSSIPACMHSSTKINAAFCDGSVRMCTGPELGNNSKATKYVNAAGSVVSL